jgi:aminoglycoside/choline kinase family phosphotransferase
VIPAEFPGLARLARRTRHVPVAVEVLPGDVGRRRYLRLFLPDTSSVLGVVYPPEEEDSRRRWIAVRAALRSRLRVPHLIADDGTGNQIVEDFGREDLAARFERVPEERGTWLDRAVRAAAAVAAAPDPGLNLPFDSAVFRRELDLARQAVFDIYLGLPLSAAEQEGHDVWAQSLSAEIAAHPRSLCHRDFHANNLFPVAEEIGVIDFQDLRSGPDAYDLASLLWERTTLEWMTPEAAEEALSSFVRERALEIGAFRERLSRILLQRAWKVCGTFARAVGQGRGEIYRRYLPGELELVRRLLGPTAPDRAFREVFEARFPSVC